MKPFNIFSGTFAIIIGILITPISLYKGKSIDSLDIFLIILCLSMGIVTLVLGLENTKD